MNEWERNRRLAEPTRKAVGQWPWPCADPRCGFLPEADTGGARAGVRASAERDFLHR